MVLKLSGLAGMFAPTGIHLVMPGTGWVSPDTNFVHSCLQAGMGAGGRSVQPCREHPSHENFLAGTEKVDSSVPRL